MNVKDRRGAAALEFALLLWPFFAIIFAIADLGHYMMVQSQLRTLAGEIARSMMIDSACVGNNGRILYPNKCANTLSTERMREIAPFTFVGNAPPDVLPPTYADGRITISVSMKNFPTILPWWGAS